MTVQEFKTAIESGKASVLTLEKAKQLIGKRIQWMYFGYSGNQDDVCESTIGSIMTLKDYYVDVVGYEDRHPKYANHYEFIKAEMPHMVRETDQNIIILDEKNQNTHMMCYGGSPFFDEPTFTCSDADREVYYMEVYED